ncbi:unnamed protein product [Phytophthora fragariaefolia]|uniref:Unnamed protein product n=1 Tax=Phytophthora fragariaefolia TaxID=1490495 RepID=A0A9W6YD99_9STRA|nr:unnamed protein product [Phytophthora fragariaefolia]
MPDAINLIRACMILHNMAIADPIPAEWIHPEPSSSGEVDGDEDLLSCDGTTRADRREYLRDSVFDNRF